MATTNVKLQPQQVRNSTISFDRYKYCLYVNSMLTQCQFKGIIVSLFTNLKFIAFLQQLQLQLQPPPLPPPPLQLQPQPPQLPQLQQQQ